MLPRQGNRLTGAGAPSEGMGMVSPWEMHDAPLLEDQVPPLG